MISRFVEGGRLINTEFSKKKALARSRATLLLKAEGRIHQAVDIDANGPPGVLPFVKEWTLISPKPFLAA